jgi:hypothetical protein
MRPNFFNYKIGYRSGNQILTQLRFIHPQLSNNTHPVDGALVGAGSLWPVIYTYIYISKRIFDVFPQSRLSRLIPGGGLVPISDTRNALVWYPFSPLVLKMMPRLSRLIPGGGLVPISDTRNNRVWYPFSPFSPDDDDNVKIVHFDTRRCLVRISDTRNTQVWHPFSPSVPMMHAEIDRINNRRGFVPISDTRNTLVWHPFSPSVLMMHAEMDQIDNRRGLCPFMIPGTLWSGTPPPPQS